MQTVDLLETNKTLRMLVYGKPGSGKTTLLGTANDDDRTAPVLHIDASGNPQSLVRRNKARKLPHVLKLERLRELNNIYEFFAMGQPENHPLCTQMGCVPGYKTLVFDGITAIQRKSFKVVLGRENLQPGDIPALAEWPHYRSVLEQMLTIATAFLQELTDIHVLVSCLEHTETRERIPGNHKTAYLYAEPALQGQAVTELPGEALAVLRLAHTSEFVTNPDIPKTTKANYCIAQTIASDYAYAKDQHGFKGHVIRDSIYIPDPTIPMLLDQLEAK